MRLNETDRIKIFRELSELIPELTDTYRAQNTLRGAMLLDRVYELTDKAFSELSADGRNAVKDSLLNLSDAVMREDFTLSADILETGFLPVFTSALSDCVFEQLDLEKVTENEKISEDVSVELTALGRYTLLVGDTYLHSNVSPAYEGRLLAKSWYRPELPMAFVWGIGLGYHVLELQKLDPYQKIKVFEPNKDVVLAYEKYGVKSDIDAFGRVEIVLDPEGKKFSEASGKHPEIPLFIHYPTLIAMKNEDLKASLKKYNATFVSIANQKELLTASFRENTALPFKNFDELSFSPAAKRAFIISAGPSLDGNYMEFKNKKDEDILFATAPTLRKLYGTGIEPDCVVICDAKPELTRLHKGAENAECPLVFSSTACAGFVKEHKGERYILCQEGFEPAEKLASENGFRTFRSAGSVAIVALRAAIMKGFKEIVFVGQDLCYLGDKMHAEGTSQHLSADNETRKKALDIFGRDVTVPANLEIFKIEIEKIISENKDIKFYNATEGGLHIEGTTDVLLKNIL